MCMDGIKLFAKKWKELENFIKNSKNIQPRYRNGFWHWKMCQADDKWEMRNNEGIELSNQESIRTLGEKENHKYLGI